MRRNRPGTRQADLWAWELEDVQAMQGPLAVQEYIQELIRNDPSNVQLICEPPNDVDINVWQYEHLRQFILELNLLITQLKGICTSQTCPKMKATEDWLYLCAAHKNAHECSAIDYMVHNLDQSTSILQNIKNYNSRVSIPDSAVKNLAPIVRRLYRLFTHTYCNHREIFVDFESIHSVFAQVRYDASQATHDSQERTPTAGVSGSYIALTISISNSNHLQKETTIIFVNLSQQLVRFDSLIEQTKGSGYVGRQVRQQVSWDGLIVMGSINVLAINLDAINSLQDSLAQLLSSTDRFMDKDFPSLGGLTNPPSTSQSTQKQSQQNLLQSQSKKPTKQIAFDKTNSVQLNGAGGNDFVGFYFDGSASQPTHSQQDRGQYNNSNKNNRQQQQQQQHKNNKSNQVFIEREQQPQSSAVNNSLSNSNNRSQVNYVQKTEQANQQKHQYQEKPQQQQQQGQTQYTRKVQEPTQQQPQQQQQTQYVKKTQQESNSSSNVVYARKEVSDTNNTEQQQNNQQQQKPKLKVSKQPVVFVEKKPVVQSYSQPQQQQHQQQQQQNTVYQRKQQDQQRPDTVPAADHRSTNNQNNQAPQTASEQNNPRNNNKNSKKKDNKRASGVTARQKEAAKQESANEWSSDAKKYINPDQVFYMGEDSYYHESSASKFRGNRPRELQKVLMVAEKPSIAKSIAEALSNGTSRSVQGYSRFLPVHTFEGMFRGKRVEFRITSVAGHVYSLDFTQENQNWGKVNPVNLFTARTVKVEANPSSNVVKHLEIEAKDASYLLLWLDNDREGENICFEVQGICERVMCQEGQNTQQVLRAKFSSLTKQDLIASFKNISDPPNANESKAADARQIIDLKIGSAFTRYQTLFFRNKYPDLAQNIISFGPCQTPTMGFCVAREDEIKAFKPKLYYRVRVTFLTEDKREVVSYYDKGHIFNQAEAAKIHSEISNESYVRIDSVTSDLGSKQRPEGLNTVQLLKIGSSYLNMSPMDTMHVAERLYLAGYITYPRTESTAYPKAFNFKEILESLTEDSDLSKYASSLIANGYNAPRNGVDKGDHPPITPTADYPFNLYGEEGKLYDYIARHFIGSLSEDCKYHKISIHSSVLGYSFVAKGIQMVKRGYLEVLDATTSLGENTIASNLRAGDKLPAGSISLEQDYTSAPGFITESELIGLMEKHRIGTDASMATHIQNICNRGYVNITGSSRQLVPTDLGRSLYHGYFKIDSDLVQPQIRARIENLVDLIAEGKKSFAEVINESMSIFQSKFLTFIENIAHMDFLFGSFCTTIEDTLDTAKPFSKCGKCKRFMKVIEKAGKIICQKCDESHSIPTNGKYKLAGEKFCPYDGFQVIFFTSSHTPNVSFEVCPKCYTNSPLLDSDQVTCSVCTNDACKLSVNSRFLKECKICNVGDIVVEPSVAQKVAASCNECWTQWSISVQVKDIQVSKEKQCNKCTSRLVSFTHVPTQPKQQKPGEAQSKEVERIIKFSKTEFSDVCFFCDPELTSECHEVEYREPRRRRYARTKKRQ